MGQSPPAFWQAQAGDRAALDRVKGFKVLPKRWIVERTFGWFYKSRRLCRDYEVRLDHSEAMLRICMIRIMVRRLAKVQ